MMAGLQITIALGTDDITVLLADREQVLPLERTLRPRLEDPGPVLQSAFGRLEAFLENEYGDDRPVGGVRLQVALVPPLSEARLVDLPPLRPAEIEPVLRRIAPRHFPGGAHALVVSGERFDRRSAARTGPVFATAADRNLVEAVQKAVESRGWKLERIVAAQACWLEALQEAAPLPVKDRSAGNSEPKRLVVAVVGNVIHLLRLTGRVPDLLRRFGADDPAGAIEAAGPEPGQVLVLAGEQLRTGITRTFAGAGWEPLSTGPERGAVAGAAVEAARHVPGARPELVSTLTAQVRTRHDRRSARVMVAAAVLLLAVAAGVHLWGLDRALDQVRSERLVLRQMFEPALAKNDSLESMIGRIESLQALEQNTSRWTAFLVELSALLPQDTHLVSLRGEGDRVIVEAVGDRAGSALTALRGASTFGETRIEGLIRRDLEDGLTSREHFTLSLVLARGGDR